MCGIFTRYCTTRRRVREIHYSQEETCINLMVFATYITFMLSRGWRQLTGLILPRGEVVQVDAIAEHENVGLWADLAAKKREKREKTMLKARGQGQ